MTAAIPDAPNEISIRPVTAFDLALLAALHAEIFTAPWDQRWSAQSFAEILAMPGAHGWLMARGDTPVGFMLARFVHDEGEILLTGIVPAAQRHGHGGRLMRVLLESARDAGVGTLFLEHAAGNAAAAALYERFGFAKIGRRRAYYERRGGGREDAITLSCALAAGDTPPKSDLRA